MTESSPQSSGAFWRAVGAFFKFLLRLTIAIVIGILIGVGLYYGVPWTYRTFVRPVQENTARITALEQRTAQEQTRTKAELQGFQERLTTLEEALQAARDETASRDEALASQAQALRAATARVATLEAQLLQAEADVQAQGGILADFWVALDAAQGTMAAKDAAVSLQVDTLEGRMALLQTAQDLLRVRLLLLEENPRAAAEAVALAISHLERARASLPDLEAQLSPLRTRLGELQTLIEQRSFRVGLELEALWAEVMELVLPAPVAPAVAPAEATPALSPLSTPPAP